MQSNFYGPRLFISFFSLGFLSLQGLAFSAPFSNLEKVEAPIFTQGMTFLHKEAIDRKRIFDQNRIIAADSLRLKKDSKGQVQVVPMKLRTQNSQKKSFSYVAQHALPAVKRRVRIEKTSFQVINEDSLNHALALRAKGYRPLVMDFANAFHVCGGASSGVSRAQEEQLAYRTNLYDILLPFRQKKPRGNFLPDRGGIFASNVTVLREGPKKGYAFSPHAIEIDIYATAAYRHKSLHHVGLEAEEDRFPALKDPKRYRAGMRDKVFSLFEAAIKEGNDALVLGAWGCGMFQNPPRDIIKLFKEAIARYGHFFKKIDFAILAPNKADPIYKAFATTKWS